MMEKQITVTAKVTKVVTHLLADCGVRYWEDTKINGEYDDELNPSIPFKEGERWVIKIDLRNGVIEDWPSGITAEVHYKVCDDGVYSLLDSNGKTVVKIDGYVPDILCPESDGDGDYVIMNIDENGRIDNWETSFEEFEFCQD